jgi:putative transposase
MDDDLYFAGRYRIPSARLNNWDYRSSGFYFITICTKGLKPCFGYISGEKMVFNELGRFANKHLTGLYTQKKNLQLINHVVMPNHVHALLSLKNAIAEKQLNRFGSLIPSSLSSVINHYKGRITRYAHDNHLDWDGWQERFHDHIIRSSESFNRINDYITANPARWESDRYNRNIPVQ